MKTGKEVMMKVAIAMIVASVSASQAIAVDDLSLNVAPLTECVSTGETITVTLDVANLSAAVNGVQVRLNYDTTLMTLIDIVPTDLGLSLPDQGWVEVSQTDAAGDIDWAAVINGGSISLPHTIATLTFTAIADGTATITFRPDANPFFTKLTRAIDSSTIFPNKFDSNADFNTDGVGNAFIGPPDATVTADAAVCDGTSGHIASVPDAGVGANYVWTVTGGTIDSGQGTTTLSYTATDPTSVTIDVIVTDPDGCSANGQSIVTVNPNPACLITAAASVCALSTGNPASIPDAGVGATYIWSIAGGAVVSGQGTAAITFSAATGPNVTIDVTVTDANGCVSSCQKIIAVAAPDCTITASDAVCDGSTGNVSSVTDAGVGATYTWVVTGGTITSGAGTPSITYTATDPTSVTIDITVVAGDSCESSCQKIVSVNANPNATITSDAAVCDGTSGHNASVADAGVGAIYSWVVTGGTIDSGAGTNAISYTATNPTSVTIDVTVTDANGCTSTSQNIVSVNANPNATITADAAVCDGTSGHNASVADAGVGAIYSWVVTGGTIDSGAGTSAISYTATDPTSITIDITITDANGCTSSSQTIVSVNANPDCTITAADQVCDSSTGNTATVLDAGVGATYSWVVTGGTIVGLPPFGNSITYDATDPTSVTLDVIVTDANGCTSSCQKIVAINANPTCTITTAGSVCDGSTGNSATTTDVGVGATYDWVVTGGTIVGLPPFGNSITYDATNPTSVTIDLTVTDGSGCVSTCQQVVTVNANPNATITTGTAVCDGTSGHNASVANAGVGTIYSWVVTGGTIDSGAGTNSINYTATNPTSITIDITITDTNGCTSSSQSIVSVNANPNAAISTTLAVCDGTAGHVASVLDAGVGTLYTWNVTGGTINTGLGTNSISYTATDPTSITIDVIVTDANGCTSSSQTIVSVNANPDATITADAAVCDGTSGHIGSVASAGAGATYVWIVTGGTIDSGQGTTAISYTATDPSSVTLDVTVTDANLCSSNSNTIVNVNSNPTCIISAEATVCADTSGHAATVSDAGVGATYVWSVTGGTLDSGQGSTSINYTALAGVDVTLDVTVTDANGCVSSCQFVVSINPSPACTISANDLVCEGFSGNVASIPDAGVGATYLWTITGGSLNSGQGTTSISYTAGTGTSLTLNITVTDANGCISTCQKIVTVDAPNCTISSASSVCFQSIGNFATVPDSGVGASYSWTVTGGTLTSGQGSNSITYDAGSGTSVTLDITVTNSNGCVSTCQKIVTIIQPSIDVALELEGVSNVVIRDVTFVITDCGGSTDTRVLPVTTDIFGFGSVTIPGTSPNADWISTQEGHTLSRLASVTYGACFVATVNQTGAGRLIAGDFHTGSVAQDNLCDIVDFSILASQWNVVIDPNISEDADVTGDGMQDTADFTAIQVNFFSVGEAVDGCPAVSIAPSDGLQRIDSDIVRIDSTATFRSSVNVEELPLEIGLFADMTGDGVIDADDIREFAEMYGLPLLPEFNRKLNNMSRGKGMGRQRR